MLRPSLIVALLLVTLTAGCLPKKLTENNRVNLSSSSVADVQNVSLSSSTATAQQAIYADFSQEVIGNGQSSVLFFYAAWCPYCRAHDTKLQSWYGEQDLPVSTYKVDYDASLQLRARYGVLTQHTFVLIDGKGNKIASVEDYPSDEEVLTLIRTL